MGLLVVPILALRPTCPPLEPTHNAVPTGGIECTQYHYNVTLRQLGGLLIRTQSLIGFGAILVMVRMPLQLEHDVIGDPLGGIPTVLQAYRFIQVGFQEGAL
jgi:hypothetical protein